jgi:dihydroorotase
MGMLGPETALSIVQQVTVDTGRLDRAGVADRMSYRPARIGRVDGQGMVLAAGAPANLVLVDPAAHWVVEPSALASRSQNTPSRGMRLPGAVQATFLRGRPTVLDGKLA